MRRWAAAVCVAAVLPVGAQPAGTLQVDSEPGHLSCLTVPERKLEFPRGWDESKIGGVFRVKLVFSSRGAPRAEIVRATVDEPFRQMVLDHVRAYRLPCLPDGARPVEVVQEFQFLPDGRRTVESPVRLHGSRRLACLTGADRPPSYPMFSTMTGESGRVLAELVFTSAGEPSVRILFDGGRRRLSSLVKEYMTGYRMPCWTTDDGVVRLRQAFSFQLEGERRRVLQDVTLTRFLGAVENLEEQKVHFDLTTMGCPFELRVELWQPYASNGVTEIGTHDPERREFLEWVMRLRLRLSPAMLQQVVGDAMTVSVPCAVLNLL